MYPISKYPLTDGSFITANELSIKIGIGIAGAKLRLKMTRDPKEVFLPKGKFATKNTEQIPKPESKLKVDKKKFKESSAFRQVYDPYFCLAMKSI